MLVPKRAKYRKQFRGNMRGLSERGSTVSFGEFGLKAVSAGWVSARHIEAARRVLTRYTQKGGRVWIRIFPDKPISDKPPEVRMGGGKGDIVDYVAVVRPGRMLFEMGGITDEQAKEALNMASAKLPIKSRFVSKKLMYL
ncbi:50S ribosomal protein L16 [Candidatus Gottesmanbacteria bacterium RIFCSPHIGHO2_02_FULL_39_11]|uniref:Large ribosomal subunit protein uL16 n=1 Tax=Candidatus Gottesmanbacteria bacterium RIFCSPHIGHO2_02_FULL_39_11 TaxID=1798382 RepID=A0A1F5ZWH8_9BACT|nr:MAG: 50S ribosomal protein L16 [Candidatus Gottesmanbacteria bacterium RIFCSPHIGHO2_02_FULL_39_11]